jgi:hypothetical protein
MSDELIVCSAILILSAIITAISIIYIHAFLAITRAEECQKNEGDTIRDPVDKLRRVPEDLHSGGQSEGCNQGCIRENTGKNKHNIN